MVYGSDCVVAAISAGTEVSVTLEELDHGATYMELVCTARTDTSYIRSGYLKEESLAPFNGAVVGRVPLSECKRFGTAPLSEAVRADILRTSMENFRQGKYSLKEGGKAHMAVSAALVVLCRVLFAQKMRPYCITVKSTAKMPVSAGLGSSASFCVALTAAALQAATGQAHIDDVVQIAAGGDKILHGLNASGVDVMASAHGGVMRYRRGTTPVPLAYPDVLKTVRIFDSQQERSTAHLVGLVAQHPHREEHIETLSHAAEVGMNSDLDFVQSVSTAQRALQALGVSTPLIDRTVAQVSASGSVAKLTGAGGGGCIMVVGDAVVEGLLEVDATVCDIGYKLM